MIVGTPVYNKALRVFGRVSDWAPAVSGLVIITFKSGLGGAYWLASDVTRVPDWDPLLS